ncbi:MAG: hypothetical protein JKY30_00260 [Flavobacteriales bacterium]|nr:hypothetical protein [Flavobacteriales bacterium]
MNRLTNNSRKFCFISNSDQSYLIDYINLSRSDMNIDFSFENLNLTELKNYAPNIIVIDQYFIDTNFDSIINSIKLNFKQAKIYFLSPEYADYNGIIQSLNNPNHYYSNFSLDILNHINSITRESSNNDYLEAS